MSRPPWVQGFRLVLTVTLVPLWVGCDGDPVEPPEPTTITISPSSATLHSIDDTVQLSAFVHDQNGQVMPEVAIRWASSEPSVAATNTSGMVTAARNGRATVIARAGEVSATAEVTVEQEVAGVSVSPSADTLAALEDTVRLVGVARDANGHLIDGATFNWSSTDASVASVDISGLVTAARNGGATVIARAGAVSTNVEIFVEQEVAESRVSPSVDTLVAFGDTVRLVAEAQDANGHLIDGVAFSWASNEPSVAPVDISGLVTAARNGRTTVIARAGAVHANVEILVAQEVAEVRMSPSGDTLVALEDTVRLVAAANDAIGHLIEGAVLSWASSNTSVATVGAVGLVTAVGNGVATVIASDGAKAATAQITVAQQVAEVGVSPSAHTLGAFGDTVRLATEVRDANGHLIEGAVLSWASSNTSVATVDALGLVTAVGNGGATVTASAGEESATAQITVAQEVADVSVSPETHTLALRDTVRLAAVARDANGHAVEGATFSWSSSDASVVVVDDSGLVSAMGEGTVEINVVSGRVRATATITVSNSDRAVLRSFYEAANGANWESNANWLSEAPLAEWHGVTVDAQGRVVGLDLSWNSLTGGVTPHIGNLIHLKSLTLQVNVLEGSIPPEIGNLRNLVRLDLQSNDLSGEIPPELSTLDNLRTLWLSGNRLAGPIPPELGGLEKLAFLGLSFNYLTGPIPSELGSLIALESLRLGSGSSETNRLAGPLPPELGNLRHLGALGLTGIETLVGALPATLMALTQLESLYADGTGLCAPLDPDFQAWLRGISYRRVDDCDRVPSMAYLTQAVQSRDFGVPLVAGENALLRVFPIALFRTDIGIPKARAHFYRGGRTTYAVDIPGKSTAIPTSLDEGNLSKSANVNIPGSVIQPGLGMVIEIDPDGTLDPYLGVTKRIPEVGRLAVPVEPMPRLDLTQIPFLWSVDPDSTIIHQIDSMAADHDNHELLWGTRTLLPVGDLQVTAHEPVVTSTNHGSLLLSQTAGIRALEGGTGHYMGMMSGRVIGYAGIAYLARISHTGQPQA